MLFSNDPNDLYGQEQQQDYDPENYPKRYSEGLRSAARVLSILCVITIGFIYMSVPMGALAIIFALLSGGAHKLKKPQKNTIRTAIIGMVLSTAVTGYMFYRVYTDPALYAQFQQMVDYFTRIYNGESPADVINSTPGTTPETTAPGPDLSDPDSILEYYLTPNVENGNDAGAVSPDADAASPDAGAASPDAGAASPDAAAAPDQQADPFIPDEIGAPSGGDYT